MNVHLVTVKIGVVGVAVSIVHPDCLLFRQDPAPVGHYAGLVEGRLPVDKQGVVIGQMPIDDLSADVEELGEAIPLLWTHVFEVNLLTGLFILDHIGPRVLTCAVPDGLS